MRVTVVDRLIRHNIALFQHLMRRQLEKSRRFDELLKRTYRAYVNCDTGELKFQELSNERLAALGKQWKPILIFFSEKDESFEIKDIDNELSFDCSDLHEKAMKIMTDTLKTMSGVCAEPPKRRKAENIIRNLTQLEIELPIGDESPIHEAWHGVDRYHAEYLLQKAQVGTYLFRKGEYATKLEQLLNEDSPQPVICITVTFRDWEDKISEKTIVYKNGDWLFYDDDPDLEGESYVTINELLESQEDLFRKPLKN